MQPNIELETKVIEKFVEKNKRERYISFVSSIKNRNKFIKDLPHFDSFIWEKLDKIHGDTNKIISEINARIKLLKKLHSKCYIISEDDDLDGTLWDMETLLNSGKLYNGFATILVFGNADLIYFHDESVDQYISKI